MASENQAEYKRSGHLEQEVFWKNCFTFSHSLRDQVSLFTLSDPHRYPTMLSVKRLTKPKHSISILELDLLQFNLLQRWKELARNLLFVDYYCLTSNCCLSGVKKITSLSTALIFSCKTTKVAFDLFAHFSQARPCLPLFILRCGRQDRTPTGMGPIAGKEWLLSSSSASAHMLPPFYLSEECTTHSLQVSLWGPHQRRPTDGEIAQVLSHAQDCRQKELPMGHQKVWGPASKPPEVSLPSSLNGNNYIWLTGSRLLWGSTAGKHVSQIPALDSSV